MKASFETVMNGLVNIEKNYSRRERKAVIHAFLREITGYTDAQRTVLYEYKGKDRYECSYCYCTEEEEEKQYRKNELSIRKNMIHWHRILAERESILLKDITEIRESAWEEYRYLVKRKIHSVIAFPIYFNKLIGFVRIDNPNLEQSRQLIATLPVISSYLGSIRANYMKEDVLEWHEELLNQNRIELKREREFLDVLTRDYTSVYYVDLGTDLVEPLKVAETANAANFKEVKQRNILHYTEMVKKYAKEYVIAEQQQEFTKILSGKHLRKVLSERERIVFRYQSIPNQMKQQYFETQAVRIQESEFNDKILLGFRHVDEIVEVEQRRRKELEEALQQTRLSNEVLSAIGKIYYAIFRIDLEKDFYEEISSDSEVHHLTGKTGCASTEMIELCKKFVVPEYRDRIMQFFNLSTLADRLKNEETIAEEYLATDGNWHTARFIVKRRNKEGKVTHVLYVTRLISDTKRREQNWIAIAREANRENEAKTEFISQVAHDIRTPMNAILGFATVTEAHINEPERVRYGLEKIKMSGNFLQELVDDVLDISRIENGQMKIQYTYTNIRKLVEEFRDGIQNIGDGKHLNITYQIHDMREECLVLDPLRMKQIYTNLMSNAIKYTPEGGKVGFEVYEEPSEEAGKVRLVSIISDNGIGMSEEYMKKMYSKFSRETDTRINKVNGYGLGLSIVKQLTDLMGGTIEVQSRQGEGTTFCVCFDFTYAKAEENQGSRKEKENLADKCKGMHLLVAEDNELNYEVLKDLLEMYGMTCDQAEDGAVCVEKFKTAKPGTYDAILMDMQMPVMGGLEATRTIRNLKQSNAHTIPIIAMTANAFADDVEKCLDAGMNAHLAKPVDMKKLVEVLAEGRELEVQR